jgi:hypothetical protein
MLNAVLAGGLNTAINLGQQINRAQSKVWIALATAECRLPL